jgi:hypothetical protein
MIAFGSIDPHKGKMGAREARKLVEEYGVKGFKFHPTVQGFEPADTMAWPIYEVIAEHKLPAVFHSGHSGIGSGMRCGGGLRLQNSNPMLLEDVAIAFPDMQIIVAHPSWPWQDEAISLAMHKPNIWIDLSGWSPKYFPPQLVQYANTLLKDRILFGSDFPLITPDRWLKDFEEAGFKDEVKPLILKRNAMRLLGSDARRRRAATPPRRRASRAMTVSLFSTDLTPSVPLAIATALSALPALSASRSASRRRPWCRRRSPALHVGSASSLVLTLPVMAASRSRRPPCSSRSPSRHIAFDAAGRRRDGVVVVVVVAALPAACRSSSSSSRSGEQRGGEPRTDSGGVGSVAFMVSPGRHWMVRRCRQRCGHVDASRDRAVATPVAGRVRRARPRAPRPHAARRAELRQPGALAQAGLTR